MGDNSKSRMCNIDGQSFYPFTSRTWIGDSGASCFITNDPTGIYDAEPINESIEAANVDEGNNQGQEGCDHQTSGW